MESADKRMAALVEAGAMQWDGMDENGDAFYTFDLDLIKELEPELYDALIAEQQHDIDHLVELGLAEQVGLDDDGEPLYRLDSSL